MASVFIYILTSVFLVSLISFVGAITLSLKEENLNKTLIFLVSFSAGSLFGSVFFHLLPEATGEQGFNFEITFALLSGILICFVLEKFIRWRHCHIIPNQTHPHPFSHLILFSDSLHNFIDGLIIGGSYLISLSLGLTTTLAVIFHEIPQEIGDFGSLLYGGLGKIKALLFNFLSALSALLGGIFVLIFKNFEGLTNFLIPFAAGNFLYIAGSDLVPELHKEIEIKKSIFQLIFFIAGLLLMLVLI